jgi:hypothetical protein
MNRLLPLALLGLTLLPGIASADDVSGARHLLCSVAHADVCLADDGCATVEAAELNIPRFIQVDARSRKLHTTAASGENRETVADTSSRSDGQLILQGVEDGRAYSLYIDEASGDATFASAADSISVTVFAHCTPASGN